MEQETVNVSIVRPVCVTIDVAASMAMVSRVTIYQWIREAKLPTIRVGADQRILVSEFEKFLREGRGARTQPRKQSARPKITK